MAVLQVVQAGDIKMDDELADEVPAMIKSMNLPAVSGVAASPECCQGAAFIDSISLKEGGDSFLCVSCCTPPQHACGRSVRSANTLTALSCSVVSWPSRLIERLLLFNCAA